MTGFEDMPIYRIHLPGGKSVPLYALNYLIARGTAQRRFPGFLYISEAVFDR